jgi:hypothetical protein
MHTKPEGVGLESPLGYKMQREARYHHLSTRQVDGLTQRLRRLTTQRPYHLGKRGDFSVTSQPSTAPYLRHWQHRQHRRRYSVGPALRWSASARPKCNVGESMRVITRSPPSRAAAALPYRSCVNIPESGPSTAIPWICTHGIPLAPQRCPLASPLSCLAFRCFKKAAVTGGWGEGRCGEDLKPVRHLSSFSFCIPNAQDKGAAITTKGAAFTIPKPGVEPTSA